MDAVPLPAPWVVGLVGAALVAASIWQFWWARQARWFLERRPARELPRITRIGVRDLQLSVFPREDVRRIAQQLGRRRESQTAALDVEQTIRATLRNGGFFTPEYAPQRHVPEYVALVDRRTFHDQLARWSLELVRRLIDNEVLIDVFCYAGDPRICTPLFIRGDAFEESADGPVSLARLSNLFPASRLLMLSDGAALIDNRSGRVHSWVTVFEAWTERAIVTKVPQEEWGHREMLLREHFTLVPATLDALAGHAGRWNGEHAGDDASVQRATSIGVPHELETRSERWTYREAPPETETQAIITATRRHLGREGYLWLCGCCAYPHLDWNLTLLLGASLRDDQNQPLLTDDRLGGLLRLPWFRYGYVPDWLRARLLNSLSRRRYRTVRQVIDALLFSAVAAPGEAFRLDIASQPKTLRYLIKAILRRMAAHEDKEDTFREHVFLDFMMGRGNRLALQVPAIVAARLNEKFDAYRRWKNRRKYASEFLPPFFGHAVSSSPVAYGGRIRRHGLGPLDQATWLFRLGWFHRAEQELELRDNALLLPKFTAFFGMKPIPYKSAVRFDPEPLVTLRTMPHLTDLTVMFFTFAAMFAMLAVVVGFVVIAFAQ